jgi:hypothetical protein
MKIAIRLGKSLVRDLITLALVMLFFFFVQDAVKEIKAHEVPNYADTKGCTAEGFHFSECA